MSISLADFIQELYQGAINPATSIYLPTVLLEQTLPVDPLALGSFDFGDLSTIDSSLPTKLCAAINSGSIASPSTADMQLSGLQLVGISNVLPAQPTVTNDQVSVVLNFGTVKAQPGLPVPQALLVTGNFSIAVSCCPSQDGSSCSGASQPTAITGVVTTTFTQATATLNITVAPDYSVTANSMTFAAPTVSTTFNVTSQGLQGPALAKLLDQAFQSAQAGTAIIQAINVVLASGPFLSVLGNIILTTVFQNLANPTILSFIVSTLYKAAINPSSSEYLPKLVQGASKPVLEPYTVSGTWGLGDVSSFFSAAGNTICGGISPLGELDMCAPGTPDALTLSNISIAGFSNVTPLPPLTTGGQVTAQVAAMATFGQVTGWAHQFTIAGDFSLTVTCCPTTDLKACSGPSQQYTGFGTFSALFAAASVAASITISASDDNDLSATVTSQYFRTDPNVINPNNIQITIAITSIPAGQQSIWNQQAQNLFNSPDAATAIVAKIQEQLNQPSLLSTLCTIITQAIHNVISSDQIAAAAAELRAHS